MLQINWTIYYKDSFDTIISYKNLDFMYQKKFEFYALTNCMHLYG
jgi:hypothetical protein